MLRQIAPHLALKLGDLLEREQAGDHRAFIQNDEYDIVHKKWHLTPREWEISSSLFAGEGDQEIADRLCISFSTLRKHIYNIYKKIDVNNRVQLFSAIKTLLDNENKTRR